ncbi:MAG: DUF721 domain-containing protein [Firmicutes bacterium]|nr:DUF721 domain-containing protein [Bacillota bacterium]
MDEPRLGNILRGMVEEHGWHRAQWLRMMEAIWHRVVGDAIYAHTRILTLTPDGVLVIAVPSSVWSQELNYYRPRILGAIHDELPQVTIRDIRTRVRAQADRKRTSEDAYRRSPYAATYRAPAGTEDLGVLLTRVQEKYQEAAQEWLAEGFYPCIQCHAPTLAGYPLCVVCDLERHKNS